VSDHVLIKRAYSSVAQVSIFKPSIFREQEFAICYF